MNLVYEIQKGFANLRHGAFCEIPLSSSYSIWIYRQADAFGVAVDLDRKAKISERFATARMYTREEWIAGKPHHFLVLENTIEDLRNEFAALCAQFADPGDDGFLRLSLCADPAAWWKRWKKLLGNSVREKTTHAVLGELLVYQRLLANAAEPTWQGPNSKSHDISCPKFDVEVKSTLARYGATITVAGQYQLEPTEGKDLKIAFCRFEDVLTGGISIDIIVDHISSAGIDRHVINKLLAKIGFEDGCSAREERFVLHEDIRMYDVNGDFPKITSASFADGKMPEQITQLTYQVDLGSLPYDLLKTMVI